MVELLRRTPYAVFRVLDREGRPIGEVIQPKPGAVVGRGERTVLLMRPDQREVRNS
jgi:hypothetical protein